MKRAHSAFYELANEWRALEKLRADLPLLGASFRHFIPQSRAFRHYWFTRCLEEGK